MNKLSTFVRTFWKSLTSFAYYKDIIQARFAFSFKYFWLFSFVLGSILTVVISFTVIPTINKFLGRLSQKVTNLYPPDLVVTIKNGQVATNAVEPLHIPIPFELFTDTPPAISDQKQIYLVTIDTKAQIDDYQNSQSLIFITKDTAVVRDDNEGYRIYPLKDAGDVTLNKKMVDEFLNKIMPLLNYIPTVLVIILFVVFAFILPISRLVSLMFLNLPLLVTARLMHISLSYKKLFQVGLHALTLPTLIQVGLSVFNLTPPVPFFNSLLYILYGLIILATLKEKTPPMTTQTVPQ